MNECPRNLTKDQIIAGLKAGRSLMVDRRDAPELEDLLELEAEGLVTSKLIVVRQVIVNSIQFPSNKVKVTLFKNNQRTVLWGKYTMINVERKDND